MILIYRNTVSWQRNSIVSFYRKITFRFEVPCPWYDGIVALYDTVCNMVFIHHHSSHWTHPTCLVRGSMMLNRMSQTTWRRCHSVSLLVRLSAIFMCFVPDLHHECYLRKWSQGWYHAKHSSSSYGTNGHSRSSSLDAKRWHTSVHFSLVRLYSPGIRNGTPMASFGRGKGYYWKFTCCIDFDLLKMSQSEQIDVPYDFHISRMAGTIRSDPAWRWSTRQIRAASLAWLCRQTMNNNPFKFYHPLRNVYTNFGFFLMS